MSGNTDAVPTPTLYAAAIAIVSGAYAVLVTTGWMGGSTGAWLVLLVGVVALVHGVALVTPAAERLGEWSGPLMIAYALVMLLARAVFPMGTTGGTSPGGMGPGSMGGWMDGWMGYGMMDGAGMGMGGGLGMVALAVLMLVSGLIMTVRDGEEM